MKKNKVKIVGIKIDTKSDKYKDKIYYYKTDKQLKKGEVINVKMPTGGTATCTVANINKKGTNQKLKILDVEN